MKKAQEKCVINLLSQTKIIIKVLIILIVCIIQQYHPQFERSQSNDVLNVESLWCVTSIESNHSTAARSHEYNVSMQVALGMFLHTSRTSRSSFRRFSC